MCGKAVKVKICWAGQSDPSNLVKCLFADMMASSSSRNYLGLPSPVLLSLTRSPSRSLNLWQGIFSNPVLRDRGKWSTEYGFKGLTCSISFCASSPPIHFDSLQFTDTFLCEGAKAARRRLHKRSDGEIFI